MYTIRMTTKKMPPRKGLSLYLTHDQTNQVTKLYHFAQSYAPSIRRSDFLADSLMVGMEIIAMNCREMPKLTPRQREIALAGTRRALELARLEGGAEKWLGAGQVAAEPAEEDE